MIKCFDVVPFGRNFKCSIEKNVKIENDYASSALVQIAINVANLHRIPLLDQKCYSISPEEAALFFVASKQTDKIEFSFASELISSSFLVEPIIQSPRFAAFLFLASMKEEKEEEKEDKNQNSFVFAPRCDAIGFGAAFACYLVKEEEKIHSATTTTSQQQKRTKFDKTQQDHSIALIWTIFEEEEENGEKTSLSPHEKCGYIRLVKAVKKEGWILWMKSRKENEKEEISSSSMLLLEKVLMRYEFKIEKLC
jgi:hypothetical protein